MTRPHRSARGQRAPRLRPLLTGLWHSLDPVRQRDARRAVLLALAAVVAELSLLHALRQLLTVAAASEGPRGEWWAKQGMDGAVTLPLGVFLGVALLLTLLRLLSLRSNERLVLFVAGDLSMRLFRGAVRQPLLAQQQRETGELFAALDKTQLLTNGVLGPLLIAAANGVVGLALFAYLFALAPALTLAGGTLLAAVYLLIGRVTRPRLQRSSQDVSRLASMRMKLAHEAQSGFRDLVLNQAQATAERDFAAAESAYRRGQAETRFMAAAPRPLVEGAILALVGLLAVYLMRAGADFAAVVPLAGTLAIGAQRLLPMVNSAHQAWGQFLGNSAVLADVLDLAGRPLPPAATPEGSALGFERELALCGVGLRYPGRDWILRGLDLQIARGERIGIMGATGAGKSSLLDVLLGLVEPDEGCVRVDGVSLDDAIARTRWQRAVALVPQSIYLPDRELRELIAFPHGQERIDPERLAAAVHAAQLADFVASLPQGLATRVGDRGVRLSGGQRQRIALARALYRRPAVLILDEATGQLDRDTEQRVIAALAGLAASTTLIVVSHRLSAFTGCDRVLQLRQGSLTPFERPAEGALR